MTPSTPPSSSSEPAEPSPEPSAERSAVGTFERVLGHALVLLVLELGLIWALNSTSAWSYVDLLSLGALGMPWTLVVPALYSHGAAPLAATVLVMGPIGNLLLRAYGYHRRVDEKARFTPG